MMKKRILVKKCLSVGVVLIAVVGLAACSSDDSATSTSSSTIESTSESEAPPKRLTKQEVIDELGLEKTEDRNSDIFASNIEKLEQAGYIIINSNDVYGGIYESEKAVLEAKNLKVKGIKSPAKDTITAGRIFETNYPQEIGLSTEYIGPSYKILSKGDQVILNYYDAEEMDESESSQTDDSETEDSSEKTTTKKAGSSSSQKLIKELDLEETEDHDSSIYVENREKLEDAGYIVINNSEVFNKDFDTVKATLEAQGLKVKGTEGKAAEGDKAAGSIYETNYPQQIKFSTNYLGTALRVLTEGDQVIVTYYK